MDKHRFFFRAVRDFEKKKIASLLEGKLTIRLKNKLATLNT